MHGDNTKSFLNFALLADHIEAVTNKKLDQTAFLFYKGDINNLEVLTYRELIVSAKKVAAYILSRNFSEKNIMICYTAGPEFIIAFLGCLFAGATAVLAPYIDIIPNSLNRTRIKWIQETLDVQMILAGDETSEILEFNGIDVKKIAQSSIRLDLPKEFPENFVTHITLTSGSTNEPKYSASNHHSLMYSLNYISELCKFSEKNIHLALNHPFGISGLMLGYLLPIYHGTHGLIIPTKTYLDQPLLFLRLIGQYKVTHTTVPHFLLDYLVRFIRQNNIKISEMNFDLSVLDSVNISGEIVHEKTLRQFYKDFESSGFTFDKFRVIYGMTEALGIISATSKTTRLIKYIDILSACHDNVITVSRDSVSRDEINQAIPITSAGSAYGDVDLVIVNPLNQQYIESDLIIGDVYFSSPSMSKGYWNKETKSFQDTSISFPGYSNKKYLYTGDRGFIKDKEIFILGRAKEIILVKEKKYYPLFIELLAASAVSGLSSNAAIAFQTDDKIILVIGLPSALKTQKTQIEKVVKSIVLNVYHLLIDEVVIIEEPSIPTVPGIPKKHRTLCKKYYLNKQLSLI